jgi:hypothetical protein
MSIETNIYIGVYIKVPNATIEFDKTLYFDPATNNPRSSKYNPETGEPNLEKLVKKTEKIHPWPDIEELLADGEEFSGDTDEFWCPQYGPWGDNFSLFMLNSTKSKYRIRHANDNEDCTDLLDRDTDYKKLIEEFKVEYKPWLAIYEREYGEIYIGYGVITYSN